MMKILIPLDGSKFAEEVLSPAAELAARSSDVEVHLVQVVNKSKVHAAWTRLPSTEHMVRAIETEMWPSTLHKELQTSEEVGVLTETRYQAEERVQHLAEEYLEDAARRFFPDGASRAVILGNDPAEEIIEYARREKVDLIAMATHGHTGLAGLLMGGVANKLLRAHVAPLFLVRPEALHEGVHEHGASSQVKAGQKSDEERRAA